MQEINYSFYVVAGLIVVAGFTRFILRRQRTLKLKSNLGISSSNKESLVPQNSPTVSSQKSSWWGALSKTRSRFLLAGNTNIKELRESLEEACIVSDLGVENTQEALNTINWTHIASLPENERHQEALLGLSSSIEPWTKAAFGEEQELWPRKIAPNLPTVIWFVGVNGVGKTTSIAKLASELKQKGYSVMLAAADTFRAAAGEQLESWAQRLDVPCVKAPEGSDSSAVLFDAINSAKAKNIDFLLCDSAGRLHNNSQLMEALHKNKRVMEKALPGSPHDVLLVLDANTGQNMIKQAEQFKDMVGVSGVILSKLDGSAKGGAVVAVARKLMLPIRRIGLGEKMEDFVPFDSSEFSLALFGIDSIKMPRPSEATSSMKAH